jgi:hypothetical protein
VGKGTRYANDSHHFICECRLLDLYAELERVRQENGGSLMHTEYYVNESTPQYWIFGLLWNLTRAHIPLQFKKLILKTLVVEFKLYLSVSVTDDGMHEDMSTSFRQELPQLLPVLRNLGYSEKIVAKSWLAKQMLEYPGP